MVVTNVHVRDVNIRLCGGVMTREITEEETKKIIDNSQSGILFMIRWRYHARVCRYYLWRSEYSRGGAGKANFMIKAFPHIAWLIRNDSNIPNPEEQITNMLGDLRGAIETAGKNWEKEGS
jgi:hypothetical protein